MGKRLAVIADDFTGSNDTGVQFSKRGLKSIVITDMGSIEKVWDKVDVLVIDTESRFDEQEIAYHKVSEAVKLLKKHGFEYIYKKLDSTLRGNIGSEVAGAMDAAGVNLAVVVPALPVNGRTTIGGIHLVNQTPLQLTEIAQDPLTPVQYSYIPDIIALQTDKKVGLINLQEVKKGTRNIVKKIKEQVTKEVEIVVIDATTNEDLKNIAKSIIELDKLIIAGSAGLAEHLPNTFKLLDRDKSISGNVLVFAGSVSDVTREQVSFASKDKCVEVIDINIEKVFCDRYREEINSLARKINNLLDNGKDIVIRSAETREKVEFARKLGAEQGLTEKQVSEKIARFMGELFSIVYKRVKVKGIVLTGGDIAIKVFEHIGALGIVVKDEILPGIPYGYFINEDFKDIPVVTKAGAFGQKDALVKIIDFLKRVNS
jgi:uncharacterized protein YgbK (DUF1537 family)